MSLLVVLVGAAAQLGILALSILSMTDPQR